MGIVKTICINHHERDFKATQVKKIVDKQNCNDLFYNSKTL